MVIPDLAFSLIIALLLSLLFAAIIHRRGPRAGFFWFFLLILLATWAGGIWARPLGPTLWGVNWLSFLIVGLIVALLATLNALRDNQDKPYRRVERDAQLNREQTIDLLDQVHRQKNTRQLTYVTLSIFFWLLLFLLIIAILSRYLLET